MVYQYQPVNPLDAFAQSFQMVRGIQDDNARRQQEQVAQQQAQQAKASFAQDLNAWQANPTREGWAQLQVKYPQLAEQAKPLADYYGERGASSITDVGARFLSASGDARRSILQDAVAAAQNSRMPDVAGVFQKALEMYDTVGPEAAEATVRATLVQNAPDVYDKVFATQSLSPVMKEYNDRVREFGRKAADAWLVTNDTKLIPVQEGGKVFEFGPGMIMREASNQTPPPAATRPPSAVLTMEQFRANADVLGAEKAAQLTTRNGIAIQVKTPAEANSLPPGTLYVTPDGEAYTR